MVEGTETYDVVIVGSGLGGLACGVMLAKEGHKVCVLERHKQIGGTLQTYVRDRVIFDSGVHYVGGLGAGQNLNLLFKYLGIMDKLKLKQLDKDAFDRIEFAGDPQIYAYAQGYDHFRETLTAAFPDEAEAIRKYCEGLQDTCAKFPLYNLRPGSSFEKMNILELDTQTFVESLTDNKKLQNVLVATNLLYAGMPYRTPFYVHALIMNHYIESSWRFVDGGSQIARYLYKEIVARGGVFFKRVNVTKLVEEGGMLRYAESADGRRFYGKLFISNVHPHNTMQMVQSDIIKKAYRNRLENLENTMSAFTLNIVLKERTFKYRNYNYYYLDEADAWCGPKYNEGNWPRMYALYWSPSSKDPEYADGVTLITHMRYEETAAWAGTFNTVTEEDERGAAYAEFKRARSERLIDFVCQKFPDLREAMVSYYAATPLTLRDYMGTDDGSLYGYAKDSQDPLRTSISARTKIPNLLLTGQNVNLHGVLGVTVSAVLTCAEILGIDSLIQKIRNA
jgi:all-trans-retinol 13,14-reductase